MKAERLQELVEQCPDGLNLKWGGKCHDCAKEITITADPREDGIHIQGGAVFELEKDRYYLKCDACYAKKPVLTHYQKCEVYARVVGYYRPVDQWNDGKRAEFENRVNYEIDADQLAEDSS